MRRRARELDKDVHSARVGYQRLALAVLWLAVVDSLQYTEIPDIYNITKLWERRKNKRKKAFYQMRYYHKRKARTRLAALTWITGSLISKRWFSMAFAPHDHEWKEWLTSFKKMHRDIKGGRKMAQDIVYAKACLKMLGPHPSGPPIKSRRGYVNWNG